MINRDVRNEMLRDKATDMVLKGGHVLTGWARESIAYGNGQKRARKVVSGYTSTCRYCHGVVRVSNGLAEPVAGEILEEPCMLNLGYQEKEYTDPQGDCIRIRFDQDRLNNITYRKCA